MPVHVFLFVGKVRLSCIQSQRGTLQGLQPPQGRSTGMPETMCITRPVDTKHHRTRAHSECATSHVHRSTLWQTLVMSLTLQTGHCRHIGDRNKKMRSHREVYWTVLKNGCNRCAVRGMRGSTSIGQTVCTMYPGMCHCRHKLASVRRKYKTKFQVNFSMYFNNNTLSVHPQSQQ